MAFWQEALGLLAVLWICQAAGTWMQMRHYRRVMQRIAEQWPDGFVGASAARGYLGKGVIAIIVAGQDALVRQIFLMEGRSVFATFRELPEMRGHDLASAASAIGQATLGRRKAIEGAMTQVRQVLQRRLADAAAIPA